MKKTNYAIFLSAVILPLMDIAVVESSDQTVSRKIIL